jgi:hypothetical protein
MVETLQKEIKEFIAQSCESYLLTTDKQIKDLAVKLDAKYRSILDDITNTEFKYILDRELITDADLKHFDLVQIGEDKFSQNHYIGAYNCIVEFKEF